MLATSDMDDDVARAIDLGAQGFLLKDAEPEAWSGRCSTWRPAAWCSTRGSRRACCPGCASP